MPRGTKKTYSAKQRAGGEYSGNVQQNGLQPRPSVDDISPADLASLIKRTGQDKRVDALARARNWMGQDGEKPKPPPPIHGYYE